MLAGEALKMDFFYFIVRILKQIVDLRKSDKLTKNYFHYFIRYIDFLLEEV